MTSQTSQDPIKLNMATFIQPNNSQELANKKWVEKIQKETKGRVQINLYSADSKAIDVMKSWSQLLEGVADIVMCSTHPPQAPQIITKCLSAFCYGASLPVTRKVIPELWKKFPDFRAEYNGAKVLYSTGSAEACIHTKKPIRTLDDFKGMKVAPAGAYPDVPGKLGMIPVPMPMPEMYPALQKGTIEGVFAPTDQLKAIPGDITGKMNLSEVTQYTVYLHLASPLLIFFAIRQDSWDHLPPDIQKVFEDSIPGMNDEFDRIILDNAQNGFSFAKTKGHEFIELAPEVMEKFYSLLEEIALDKAKTLDVQGLSGTAIFKEIRRLIKQFNKN
jgi:TRAP-type transport system periplasmic protein